LALQLAQDKTMLGNIKAKLIANRSTYPLFDSNRLRSHIESAYITMWERFQRGKPPVSFSVEP
jgi:protein O-GlcNAc transferase